MKRFFGFALLLAAISVPAFAAKNSQSLNLAGSVKVGTTQLAPGDYKVTWTGEGAAVQVTLEQKGKASVTVPAKLVDQKNGHVGIITSTVGGVDVLQTIQLKDFSLVLSGAPAQGE
jgi:hypothetical protein